MARHYNRGGMARDPVRRPSSSRGSSSGSSSSGGMRPSSSGGSSRPAYNSRDELLNTNWKQLQNEAEARGDYQAAARYEAARNDKIATQEYKGWGGKQTQTNIYGGGMRPSSGGWSGGSSGGWSSPSRPANMGRLPSGTIQNSGFGYGTIAPTTPGRHNPDNNPMAGQTFTPGTILGDRGQLHKDLYDGKHIVYDRGHGMGLGSFYLDKPWKEGVDYSEEAEYYAQQGDWDAVDDALMRRAHKRWDTGSLGGGRDEMMVWKELNDRYGGPSAGKNLQDMYMGGGQAYGYGGKWGLDGDSDPSYDSLPWESMLSKEEYMNTFYGPQDGYGGYGPDGPGLPGGYDGGGYGSFEDWLGGMGYNDMAEQTKAAIQAAVQQAMNGYNAQIDAVNKDTDELARQAYIAKMQGEKNLDQQLAANGYAGGMADSQRIASEAGYQDRLSQLDMQAEATIAELQRAIQNAQLTGDMQTAQELSGYLQQMQGQWNAYMQNQQQMAQQDYWNQQNMANQDYWNQQQMDQQNRENNYARAMTMLQAGILPDDYTLNAAGINKGVAQQMVQQALMAQTAQAAPKATPKAAPKGPAPKGPAPKGPAPMPPAPKTEEPAKTGNSPALFIVNNPTMTTAQKIDAIEKYVKKGPANGGITEEEGLAYLAALGY